MIQDVKAEWAEQDRNQSHNLLDDPIIQRVGNNLGALTMWGLGQLTGNKSYIDTSLGWMSDYGDANQGLAIAVTLAGGRLGRVEAPTAPDFVVSPNGTAFPVPKGAQGPVPVVNRAGTQTGTAFTGGAGGANGQVSTMRVMDATPPRGASPGYPNGYIKYENANGQGVNPATGKTIPNTESHYPVQ